MILYCVQHAGLIIRSIIHKLLFHPQDEAVFFVDKDTSSSYCPPIEKIKYYRMPDPQKIIRSSPDSQDEVKRVCNETISAFFSELSLDPLQFSHIYAIFDLYNVFILYFEMNSIKYIAIEASSVIFNLHSTPAFIDERPKEEYAYNSLIMDMHLQDGNGENCIKAFIGSGKSPYLGKAPAEIYSYFWSIYHLSEEHKRIITEAYGVDKYEFGALLIFNSPMFVSGTLRNFGVKMPEKFTGDDGYGVVQYFYKTVIDYYYSDVDFILKLHPESDEKFEEAFSDYKQVPRGVPSETLCLTGRQFDVLCPIKSDSIRTFQPMGYNVSFFGKHLIPFFEYLPFSFLAFTLINAIVTPKRIAVHRINRLQLDNFKEWAFKDFREVEFEKLDVSGVGSSAFILANPDESFNGIIEYAPQECLIFVYGDYEAPAAFAQQKMICTLTDVSGDGEEELQRFGWSLVSKSSALLDVVKDYNASYTLEHAKVRVDSSPCG